MSGTLDILAENAVKGEERFFDSSTLESTVMKLTTKAIIFQNSSGGTGALTCGFTKEEEELIEKYHKLVDKSKVKGSPAHYRANFLKRTIRGGEKMSKGEMDSLLKLGKLSVMETHQGASQMKEQLAKLMFHVLKDHKDINVLKDTITTCITNLHPLEISRTQEKRATTEAIKAKEKLEALILTCGKIPAESRGKLHGVVTQLCSSLTTAVAILVENRKIANTPGLLRLMEGGKWLNLRGEFERAEADPTFRSLLRNHPWFKKRFQDGRPVDITMLHGLGWEEEFSLTGCAMSPQVMSSLHGIAPQNASDLHVITNLSF